MKDPIPLDYQFWSKLDGWTYRDAALLLCGFDPDQAKGLGIRLDGRNHPAKYAEASKVYRILKSAPDLGHNQAHPFAIIEFALKKDLPMPKPLFQTIRERYCLELNFDVRDVNDNLGKEDEAEPEPEPHPRTRKFLLRLIYVMASRGYGFKLDKPYNDAKEIAEDAERMGLVLDRGAVARYLREAHRLAESGTIAD
jgi:hypothetical protein